MTINENLHRTISHVKRSARRLLKGSTPAPPVFDNERIVGELIENRLTAEPHLRPLYDEMTDEMAYRHFGQDEAIEWEHLRRGVRYFHAWRVHVLRQRIGARLAAAAIVDVGDTDGLILKHLGKEGLGFNLSEAAIRNIRSNGIEARLGDGHGLPFDDGAYDYVFCFETLEHVENPHQVLSELGRVCRPDGRVFVSVPWVPRTFIHPRDESHPRGAMHIFEFCRTDFGALVSHTALRIAWEDVCDLLGPPEEAVTTEQRRFVDCTHDEHIVASTFRRFQFFELAVR